MKNWKVKNHLDGFKEMHSKHWEKKKKQEKKTSNTDANTFGPKYCRYIESGESMNNELKRESGD